MTSSFSVAAIPRAARRWGPVLLWMAGIFVFSSLPQPLGPLSRSDRSELYGRAAHFLEYAGLAALMYRAVVEGRTRARALLISLAAALAYAVFDEVHQELVGGRGFEWIDLAFDTAGAIAALGLIQLG